MIEDINPAAALLAVGGFFIGIFVAKAGGGAGPLLSFFSGVASFISSYIVVSIIAR